MVFMFSEHEEPETEDAEDEKRKVSFGPSESSYSEENSSTKIKIGDSVNFIEIIHSQDFEEPPSSTMTQKDDFMMPPGNNPVKPFLG